MSVLLNEVVDGLDHLKTGGRVIDCTVGGGGHAEGLLLKYPNISLIGIDRDESALEVAKGRLSDFENRIVLFRSNFVDLESMLDELKISKVDAIIADLGLSSFQIDEDERGFSFKKNGPLDMRMGLNEKSAYDVVNTYDIEELECVIRDYSEERFSHRIASGIIDNRPIHTTEAFSKVIFSSLPGYAKKDWKKIVTRVFQGIRIEVNDEIENLKKLLGISVTRLRSGGRISVISFHSLEDRLVKRAFLEKEFVPLTKKPIIPDDDEINMNPRSRSAKLRIAERV